jgi:nucleoid-associated protein YgaU
MNLQAWAGKFLLWSAVLVVVSGVLAPTMIRAQARVSEGEFLTEEQYKKLDKKEAAAYCLELANELDRQTDRRAGLNDQLSAEQKEIARLRDELSKIGSQISAVESETSRWKTFPLKSAVYNTSHTVVQGECLYKISGYDDVYGDPLKWPRIYRANRDQIKDPNLIYPGWVLTIPHGFPTSWTVYRGEYLSKIAGYWEIYDDPAKWPRIYEANKDQIKDPDLINPGQVLEIPR